MKKITVAICTYNRERYLPQVLNSVVNQTVSTNNYELIVVNNNSPGNTEEICKEFEQKHIDINFTHYLETNQGLSFARNRAIEESSCELITFLDDDAFIDEKYLEELILFFEKNPKTAAIGGKILLHYESIVPDWENKYLNSLLGFYDKGDSVFTYNNKDYPRGSNMAFQTSVFKEIGMFNVELGRIGGNLLGGEEKDIFDRIYRAEKYEVVYLPSAVVFHCVPESRTTKDFIIQQALGTGKSERVRTKHIGNFAFLKRIFFELVKWAGSIALWFGYLFKGKKAKGNMIVTFRWWVSKGLMTK